MDHNPPIIQVQLEMTIMDTDAIMTEKIIKFETGVVRCRKPGTPTSMASEEGDREGSRSAAIDRNT